MKSHEINYFFLINVNKKSTVNTIVWSLAFFGMHWQYNADTGVWKLPFT